MALPAARHTAPSSRLLVTEEPSSRSQGCCRGTRGRQGLATQRGATPQKTCPREKRGWRDLRRPGSGLSCRSGGGWRSRAGASGCGCGRSPTRSGSRRTHQGCRLRGARSQESCQHTNRKRGARRCSWHPQQPSLLPSSSTKGLVPGPDPKFLPTQGSRPRPHAVPLTHAEGEGAERSPQHGAGAPGTGVAASLHKVLLRHPPRHAQHDVEEEGELGTEGTSPGTAPLQARHPRAPRCPRGVSPGWAAPPSPAPCRCRRPGAG